MTTTTRVLTRRRLLTSAAVVGLALSGAAAGAAASAQSPTSAPADLVPVRIAGIGATAPDAAPGTPLQLGGVVGYALHLGVLQDSLNDAGFEFTELISTTRTADAILTMVNGDAEVAISGDSPAVLSRARGDDQRAIYLSPPSGDGWIVAGADAQPDGLQWLAGKTVGVITGSNFDYALRGALTEEGILDDVTLTHLVAPDGLAALQGGDIDAYATAAATTASWVEQFDLSVVAKTSETYPEFLSVNVATANGGFLDDHPAFPAAFWAGLSQTITSIEDDPDAYYAWSSEQSGNSLDVVHQSDALRFDATTPISPEGLEAVGRTIEFQVASDTAVESFDPADWIVEPETSG